MSYSDLSGSATGCTDILSITAEESYSQLSGTCIIECRSTTKQVGDSITAVINGTTVFTGFVKKVETLEPEFMARLSCNDPLIKAVDYFLASDDPEAPFQRNNISSLNLIKDLLTEASITNVTSTEPTPVFT